MAGFGLRVLPAAIALALALVTGGCTGCRTALLEGVLASDGGTLGVRGSDGQVGSVRWPEGVFGYAVRRDGDRLALTDVLGRVVAREGDRIQVGGGDNPDGSFGGCGNVIVVSRGQ